MRQVLKWIFHSRLLFVITLAVIFYGLFLVVFTVALPEGIFHYIQRKYNQFERWVEVE